MKVPADWNVNGKLAPGARMLEFQPFPSDVDVCTMLSLFVHVTVVPVATVIGFGLNAFDPIDAAPITMDTLCAPPEGVGVGLGVGLGDGVGVGVGVGVGETGVEDDGLLLQPALKAASAAANTVGMTTADTTLKRDRNIENPPCRYVQQLRCRLPASRLFGFRIDRAAADLPAAGGLT